MFEFSITRWLLSGPVLFVFIRELDGTGIAVACGGSSARNNRGEVDGASRGMPTSELDTERGSLYYSAPWWHVLPKRRVGYCAVVLAAMVTRDWVRQRGQYIVAAGVNMESCMVLRMHERARFTVYRGVLPAPSRPSLVRPHTYMDLLRRLPETDSVRFNSTHPSVAVSANE